MKERSVIYWFGFFLFLSLLYGEVRNQGQLQIIKTADLQNQALPENIQNSQDCSPSDYNNPNISMNCYGGWARHSFFVSMFRNWTNPLLVDAGQFFGLNLFSKRFAQSDTAFYMTNMSYDAVSIVSFFSLYFIRL